MKGKRKNTSDIDFGRDKVTVKTPSSGNMRRRYNAVQRP